MLWNYSRMVVACTSALVLLSSHTGKEPMEKPIHHPIVPIPAKRTTPFHIYLTFDDGPSAGSLLVNEFSGSNKLPINVFLIGRNACLNNISRDLLRFYQLNPLVEIGNHSFTHAHRRYHSYFREPAEVLDDFDRNRDSLQLKNGLARLPGRNFFRLDGLSRNESGNGRQAADTLAASGYRVFGWDLEWRRVPDKGIGLHTGEDMMGIVDKMMMDHKTFMPGHLIILLHDAEMEDEYFRSELEDFIRLVRSDGRYSFNHLSEYGNSEK
jgi:peptidoglycan/xylan/chitin deacetylase (PgdA/CDA1 family)